MRALGFEVTEHVGKTGVVAIYRNGPGPLVMVRTEIPELGFLSPAAVGGTPRFTNSSVETYAPIPKYSACPSEICPQ